MFKKLKGWLASRRREQGLKRSMSGVSVKRSWLKFQSYEDPANDWYGKLVKKDMR